MKFSLYLLIILTFLISSCKKLDESELGFDHLRFFNTAFINPGDSSKANSSIDLYSPLNDSIWYDAYSSIHGSDLGFYISAGATVGDEYWLLAPNDDKIIILSADDLSVKSEISDVQKPHSIEAGKTEVYVGSRTSKAVFAINISTHKITTIPLPYNRVTDIYYDHSFTKDKILIACHRPDCKKLYITEPNKSTLTDSVSMGIAAPYQIIRNARGIFHVLCGSTNQNIPWYIYKDHIQNSSIGTSYALPKNYQYYSIISSTEDRISQIKDLLSVIAKGTSNNSQYIATYNDKDLSLASISLGASDTSIQDLYKIYNSPSFNTYIIGNKKSGEPVAIREFDFYMNNRVSEIPIRDSNAFILLKIEI